MRGKSASFVLAVTAGLTLFTGLGIADAAPTNCSKYGGGTYSVAKCTGGDGWYQSYATCKQPQWPYYSFFIEGSWKKAKSNEESWAWCPWMSVVQSRGVGIKN